jgi:hypothetical protein
MLIDSAETTQGKTKCGAKQFLIPPVVRAAPCALLTDDDSGIGGANPSFAVLRELSHSFDRV